MFDRAEIGVPGYDADWPGPFAAGTDSSMTERVYFSEQQHSLRRPAAGLVRNEIPERVRFAVIMALRVDFVEDQLAQLWLSVVRQLHWDPELIAEDRYGNNDAERNASRLLNQIRDSDYADFLDLTGALFYAMQDGELARVDSNYHNVLNEAFVRHHSAYWQDKDGKILEPGSTVSETAIEQARGILTSAEMNGPDRQFQDAILGLRERPMPKFESALANAANALEGVARIALGDRNIAFADAVRRISKEKGLHPALAGIPVRTKDALEGAFAPGGSHMPVDDSAAIRLRRMIDGYRISQAIAVFATLDLADVIGDETHHVDELARSTGTDVGALYRLLRALAAVGVLDERPGRHFALTEMGACLRSGAAEPVGGWARLAARPYFWETWGSLLHSVKTGENAFVPTHDGMRVWDWRAQHPDESAIFGNAMRANSRVQA